LDCDEWHAEENHKERVIEREREREEGRERERDKK
jgi:hypothetical protein